MKYVVWFRQKNGDVAVFTFYSAKEAEACLELGCRLGMYGWIVTREVNV